MKQELFDLLVTYLISISLLLCSPWTGKCIGKYNLRYFYGFICCLFALVLFIAGSVFAFAIGRAVPAGGNAPTR